MTDASQISAVGVVLAAARRALLSASCSSLPRPDENFAATLPEEVPVARQRQRRDLSGRTRAALFDNAVARRVGDVLTIVLEENTNATKSAITTTKKTTTEAMAAPTLLGRAADDAWAQRAQQLAQRCHHLRRRGRQLAEQQLTGSISVTVAKRLANGNLLVRGAEVDHDQSGPRVRAHPGHRAADRHRPRQHRALDHGGRRHHRLWRDRARSTTPTPRAGWRASSTPSGCRSEGRSAICIEAAPRCDGWQLFGALALAAVLLLRRLARAERVKDLATVAGVRSNQLVGYGLVVGLERHRRSDHAGALHGAEHHQHAGEVRRDRAGQRRLADAAQERRGGHRDGRAAAFAKPGQTIDVTVASIANANSLRGGALLMTPLRGADGEVYAMAQGSMMVSGFGVAGQGRLARQRQRAERRPHSQRRDGRARGADQFGTEPFVMLNLNTPDFTTADAPDARAQQAARRGQRPGARCGFGQGAGADRSDRAGGVHRHAAGARDRARRGAGARDHQFAHRHRGDQLAGARDGRPRWRTARSRSPSPSAPDVSQPNAAARRARPW